MDSLYGDSAPSFATGKFLIDEFKRGHTTLNDKECFERLKTPIVRENIEKVYQIVIHNR